MKLFLIYVVIYGIDIRLLTSKGMEEIEAIEIDFMGSCLLLTCQDKIRLVEKHVTGVINYKQSGDSKYTVVWLCETNDGYGNRIVSRRTREGK